MATNTTNYNLVKPGYSDTADIADINGNMDIIDGQMKTNADNITTLNSKFTYKTLTHGSYVCSSIVGEGSLDTVVTGKSELQSANEVVIKFTEQTRIGAIVLSVPDKREFSTFILGSGFVLCVAAYWNKTNGSISVGCVANSWGLSTVPVGIMANTILYR